MRSTPWKEAFPNIPCGMLSGQRRGTPVQCLCRTLALIITVALAILSPVATAAPTPNKLQIDGVQVDATQKTLTILGQQFTAGRHMVVTLGEFGDITAQCQNPRPTATVITCHMSGDVGGFPPAGDYRLTVSSGPAASQSDTYDLTIGAVGPAGPPGPQGATGLIGTTVEVSCANCGELDCPDDAPAILTGGALCWGGSPAVPIAVLVELNFVRTRGFPHFAFAQCATLAGQIIPPDSFHIYCYKP